MTIVYITLSRDLRRFEFCSVRIRSCSSFIFNASAARDSLALRRSSADIAVLLFRKLVLSKFVLAPASV